MQIKGIGAKGIYRLAAYALRWDMEKESEAQRRSHILSFWRKHGLQATLDAFQVSRRTLFNWKGRLAEEGKTHGVKAISGTGIITRFSNASCFYIRSYGTCQEL